MWKCWVILLFALFSARSGLGSVTYEKWLGVVNTSDAPVTVSFVAASTSETATVAVGAPGSVMYEVPIRSAGGLAGHIVVRPKPGHDVRLPFRIVVSAVAIPAEDLIPTSVMHPSRKHAVVGGKLNEATVMRAPIIEESHIIREWRDGAARVAVFEPALLNYRLFDSAVLVCYCEVLDATDQPLTRTLIRGITASRNDWQVSNAWVMAEPEADQFLRTKRRINQCRSLERPPEYMQPWTEFDAAWFAETALSDAMVDTRYLRRLLLLGVHLYGRSNTIGRIASDIGLAQGDRVFDATLVAPGLADADVSGAEDYPFPCDRANRILRSPVRTDEVAQRMSACLPQSDLPGTRHKLALDDCISDRVNPAYLRWSLWSIGGFTALLAIGLPIVMRRITGERRVRIWIAVPALAVLFSLFAHALGRVFLPRGLQADATEYRLIHANWPESCCITLFRFLPFEDRSVRWALPPDAFLYPPEGNEKRITTRLARDNTQPVGLRNDGLECGRIYEQQVGCFRTLLSPVSVTSADTTNSALTVRIERPVREVLIRRNGQWSVFENPTNGAECVIGQTSIISDVEGLPERFEGLIREAAGASYGQVSVDGRKRPVAGRWAFVLAVSEEEELSVRLLTPAAKFTHRVVWILQVPDGNAADRREGIAP